MNPKSVTIWVCPECDSKHDSEEDMLSCCSPVEETWYLCAKCICESGKEVKKRSDKYDLVGTSYDLTKSWFVHRADITKVKDVEAAKLGAVM